jgi:hypothetical protein
MARRKKEKTVYCPTLLEALHLCLDQYLMCSYNMPNSRSEYRFDTVAVLMCVHAAIHRAEKDGSESESIKARKWAKNLSRADIRKYLNA